MDTGWFSITERRKFLRRPSALLVIVRPLHEENGQRGMIWNISPQGMALRHPQALDPGTALVIDLFDPGRRLPFPILQVIHSTPLADGSWLVGGAFVQPLESGTLQAVLPHHSSDILLVEEEAPVREMLTYGLRAEGFRIWPVANGPEAVEIYRQHQKAIGLVLLDVGMEGMDGPQTLEALRALNPDLPCWFMTGGAGRYTESELLARNARVIHKPFSLRALVPELVPLVHRGLPSPSE